MDQRIAPADPLYCQHRHLACAGGSPAKRGLRGSRRPEAESRFHDRAGRWGHASGASFAPPVPRVARLSGAASRHLLPKFAGFRIGAVNAGGAFPASIRTRYSESAVPMTERRTTGRAPAGGELQGARLLGGATCSATVAAIGSDARVASLVVPFRQWRGRGRGARVYEDAVGGVAEVDSGVGSRFVRAAREHPVTAANPYSSNRSEARALGPCAIPTPVVELRLP